MTGCSLCKELNKPHHNAHKQIFETEVEKGMSIRHLVILLKAWSIDSSRSTVAKHLKECMKIERKTLAQKAKEQFTKIPFFGREINIPKPQPKREIYNQCPYCGFPYHYKENGRTTYVMLPQSFGSQYCPKCGRAINVFEDSEKEHYETDRKILSQLR